MAIHSWRIPWTEEPDGLQPMGHKVSDTTELTEPTYEEQGEKVEAVTVFIFLGSKITEDGDCSHEIKRCFLLGRKAMTNPDSILKSKEITLPTKFHIVKAMFFPALMYGC